MSGWTNAPDRFGRLSRWLHWAMAVLILGQIPLGLSLKHLPAGLKWLWLFSLHKNIGMIVLALAILRLAWHWLSPPPHPIGDPRHWSNALALITHWTIYALLVIIPLAGWVGSSGSGIRTVIFNTWTVPPIAPESAAWQDGGFLVHTIATYVLTALLVLHIAGAIVRAGKKDGTMARMLTGRPAR